MCDCSRPPVHPLPVGRLSRSNPTRMQPQAAGAKLTRVSGPNDSSRQAARWVYAAVGVLAIAGIFTCACDTPMIWDGAYQFSFSLIRQQPYFYLTRFHSF